MLPIFDGGCKENTLDKAWSMTPICIVNLLYNNTCNSFSSLFHQNTSIAKTMIGLTEALTLIHMILPLPPLVELTTVMDSNLRLFLLKTPTNHDTWEEKSGKVGEVMIVEHFDQVYNCASVLNMRKG